MWTLAQSAALVVAGLVGAVVEDPSTGVTATLSFQGVPGQASARLDRPLTLRPGDDLVLEVRLSNRTKEPWSAPMQWVHSDASLSIRDSTGRRLQGWSISRHYVQDAKLWVHPGETASFTFDLLERYFPEMSPGHRVDSLYRPGRYTAQLIVRVPRGYRQRGSSVGELRWKTLLVSAPLTFVMRPLSDEEVADLLFGIADCDVPVRRKRLDLLGVTRAAQAVKRIRALASVDPDPEVRVTALYALGYIGDASVAGEVEVLLLEDPSARCRAAAAWALGELGLPRSVPALVAALHRRKKWPKEKDGSRPVELWSRVVANALRKMGDERALPELREVACGSPREGDREAAKRAVKEITTRAEEQRK